MNQTIASSRFSAANLAAEAAMIRRRELNASVDELARRSKRETRNAATLAVVTALLYFALGAFAAVQF